MTTSGKAVKTLVPGVKGHVPGAVKNEGGAKSVPYTHRDSEKSGSSAGTKIPGF